MGRPFCENFLIFVKCPRDSKKKSDWFRCKKISQNLKHLNFRCEQSERYFFLLFYSFHHSAHVPCEKFRWRQAKSGSRNQALDANRAKDVSFRPILLVSPLCICLMQRISFVTGERCEWEIRLVTYAMYIWTIFCHTSDFLNITSHLVRQEMGAL